MTSGLCRLLTRRRRLASGLSEHAKHYGTIPNAAPLDPANFQATGAAFARMSSLLNHVLLSQRLQFLHKISTLEEMVEDLGKDYRHAADDLAEGMALNPKKMWDEVDSDHYDLNTCLREAMCFQSFLIALPESQLVLSKNRSPASRCRRNRCPLPPRVIRPRRVTASRRIVKSDRPLASGKLAPE